MDRANNYTLPQKKNHLLNEETEEYGKDKEKAFVIEVTPATSVWL